MADNAIFLHCLSSIPKGRFTTYGQLAKMCGVHVRQIMPWLKQLPNDSSLPWYRIMNSQFKISSHPNQQQQHQLLAEEGLLPNKTGKYPVEQFWP